MDYLKKILTLIQVINKFVVINMYFDIITFGCKLNQAESEKIAADLNSIGLIQNKNKPQIIIINACAVTHKAVREARQKVAQLKRKFPRTQIIITGCFVNIDWPGVDLWVKDKNKIKNIIYKKYKKNKQIFISKKEKIKIRSRALIKIQIGCNNFCSYCIVPFTRGSKLIDTPAKEIIKQILIKEQQGFKEVILTGVNIGLYGYYKKKKLVDLLKYILLHTTIPRIRLGSIWPTHITNDLIKLYAQEPRLCPHFHLSIQSGSNKILKLMNRRYTIGQIKNIVKKCRAKIPHINFTTDIIVGFPGETEQNFQASIKLIQSIGFSKVHIFKYSQRPGTRAITMPNQIDAKIKNERSRQLIKLVEQTAQQTKQKFVGIQLPVLWEQQRDNYYYGFTNNYIRVKVKQTKNKKLTNSIELIEVTKNILSN